MLSARSAGDRDHAFASPVSAPTRDGRTKVPFIAERGVSSGKNVPIGETKFAPSNGSCLWGCGGEKPVPAPDTVVLTLSGCSKNPATRNNGSFRAIAN
jgi:hypothetical protein